MFMVLQVFASSSKDIILLKLKYMDIFQEIVWLNLFFVKSLEMSLKSSRKIQVGKKNARIAETATNSMSFLFNIEYICMCVFAIFGNVKFPFRMKCKVQIIACSWKVLFLYIITWMEYTKWFFFPFRIFLFCSHFNLYAHNYPAFSPSKPSYGNHNDGFYMFLFQVNYILSFDVDL